MNWSVGSSGQIGTIVLGNALLCSGGPVVAAEPEPEVPSEVSGLRSRVPGESYRDSYHDPSATSASEAAVDIKLALSDFDRGRQEASDH